MHLAEKDRNDKSGKRLSTGKIILLNIAVIAIGLIAFALIHHVLPYYGILKWEGNEPVIRTAPTPAPVATPLPAAKDEPSDPSDLNVSVSEPSEETEPESDPEPAAEPEPVRVYHGAWGEKLADKFTDGDVIQTDDTYISENINVSYERVERDGVIYFLADVYVCDIGYLRSGFGNGKYNGGFQTIADMAKQENAVAAVSGDHYAGRGEGVVLRNGVLYRDTTFQDVCVLYLDGTMDTMTNSEFDLNTVVEKSPYQIWTFGPELLDDEGHPKDNSRNSIFRNNPRAAIGYVEPGHYYLLEVEGSRTGAYSGSRGMTLQEMSELFESLGCLCAYNLDGGRSVGFAWMGERVSFDYNRNIPDIIYVADELPA